MEALSRSHEEAGAFIELLDRLHQGTGLLPRDVVKDGNCGVWSFLSLRRGSPFKTLWPRECTVPEMLDERKMLADLWTEIAVNMPTG